jgi:formiminoglutamate deiminase
VTPIRLFAQRAWLGGDSVARDVVFDVDGERFVAVRPGTVAPPEAVRLPGVVLPGLANAHSHAFHRALRGRTHTGAGDFWAWRERMYAVAARLDPDGYRALARAAYAEMALAGVTAVGEFHYLHHAPGGAAYVDPNAMGSALAAAAADAGIRLTLLDACYLQADVDGRPLAGPQLRFGDGTVDAWAARVDKLSAPRVGAAIHSVRAVPPDGIRAVAEWARDRGVPLHLHLSEQRRENEACRAATGRSPTQLCADTGVLGAATTAVHATHVTDGDVTLLGAARTTVCLCPTTERDLADGVGPAAALAAAGTPLAVGSDSHAVVDLFEEARAVELDQRLGTERRGHHRPAALLTAVTAGGMAALGWPAGALRAGALADLVAVRTDTPRLAGVADEDLVAGLVFAATAADVSHVVVGGRLVVADGRHVAVDVPRALDAAIAAVFR